MTEQQRIESALAAIPPDIDRDTWARLAMAVKSELGDSGFEVFDTWSQGADNYSASAARDTWKSIRPGGGVGIATLFFVAKEHGWQPSGEYTPPSAEAQEQRRRQREAEQAKAEAEAKHLAAKAHQRAGHMWSQAQPAPADHGYLQAKGIQAHGLRLLEGDLTLAGCDCRGALLVPIKDTAGKLHSLEFITAGGEKRFLPNGERPGHFHLLGSLDDAAGWLAICEGYATAASVREATGWPAVCAFSDNNLLPVAQALRAKFPAARFLICADDDFEAPRGNPGLTRARAAAQAVGGVLYVPDFAGIEPRGTDANDLAQAAGLAELARQLRAAADAGPVGLPAAAEAGETGAAPAPATAQDKPAAAQSDAAAPAPGGAKVLPFPAAGSGKKPRASGGGGGQGGSGGANGGGGGDDGPFANREVGQYRLADGVIYQLKNTREGEQIQIPLANFACLIVEQVHRDDGLEDETVFAVEGRLNSGRALSRVEVPAASFAGMAWVLKHWGALPVLYAGQSVKDNFRAGVQMLSGEVHSRTVYAHSGWRRIGAAWHYLHGAGAVAADGQPAGVEVDMGKGHMGRYVLPAPLPAGKPHVVAVRRLLDFLELAPGNPALGAALLAAVCRAPLAEAYRVDHGLFLAGTSGAQKSEAAALALACFGSFDARSFPANWSDSESDLEAKAHAAKDALFVIDDFKPVGAQADVQRLHSKADRLFRGVGNQAGRGRRGPDMKGRAAYHARGLVLATGEDVPKGVSLRARLLIVELARGDVDLARLSALQQAARDGELAQAMAGFLQWLAGRMDDLKASLPDKVRALRDKTLAEGWATSHPRAAEMHASLFVGAGLFVARYAVEIGAMTAEEAGGILNHYSVALRAALERQGDFVKESDEGERFLALLRAALSSGRAHLADSNTQGAPDVRPHGWGWRGAPDKPDDQRAMGDCIGWVSAKLGQAWLNPDAAYAAAQELARAQGETLTTSAPSLWRMFQERGWLASVEPSKSGKPITTVKRVIGGNSKRCLVLSAPLLESVE